MALKFFSTARQVQTTIPCKACGAMLEGRRSCHEAQLYCPACKKYFAIQEYVTQMDDALEEWLETLFCNRI